MKKTCIAVIILLNCLLIGSLWANLPTDDDKKCKCEDGEITEVPENECVDVRIGFGRSANEKEIDLKAFFQVYAMRPSPVVYSPQGLQYHNQILNPLHKIYMNSNRLTRKTETIDELTRIYYVDDSNNRYESDQVLDMPSDIRRKITIFTYNRELLEFVFRNDTGEAKVSTNQNNLQYIMKMVDSTGNMVTNLPVYYDIYHGDGDFIRYSAANGEVVSIHSASGRVITPSTPSVGLEVIKDDAGSIRQLYSAADGLADVVVTETGAKYEIRLYTYDQVGEKSDGLYAANGNPHTVWRFEKINPMNNNHLRVTKIYGDTSEEYNYLYSHNVNDWMLTYPDNLVVTSKSTSWDYSNTVKSTTKTKSSAGKVAMKTVEITQKFPFGERLVASILDPNGVNRKTNYTYTGSGFVASINMPSGGWNVLSYDANDRVIKVKSPWKNAAFDSADENCRITYTSYVGLDSRDVVKSSDSRPRTKEVKTLGITTEKSMYAYYFDNGSYYEVEERCVSPTALWGDSSSLRTVKQFYPSTASIAANGRLEKITKPDDTTETYTYEYGNWSQAATPGESVFTPGNGAALRISKINGTANSPAGIAFKTTKETTVYDPRGNEVQKETYVYTGTDYERINWEVCTYNPRNQMTARYFSNNTYETYTWNCCNKESETLVDGTQYTYTYDAMKRLIAKTKVGHNEQPDLVTSFEYDAADRIIKETVSGGNLSVFSSTEYNLAGQTIKKTDKQGLITTFSYLSGINTGNNLRGETQTTIWPGEFTTIKETFCDGQIIAMTGTAQVSQYYDYGVNNDGSTWIITRSGGGDSPRYVKTTSNLINQPATEEKPGLGNTILQKQYIYNAKAQLIKTTETNKLDTLFVYDEIGNLVRNGFDLDQNGALDLASNDRISDSSTIYQKDGSDWWMVQTQSVYALSDNANPTITDISKTRLAGFNGNIIGEHQNIDIHGNTTVQTTMLNRSDKQKTLETRYPDSSISGQQVVINGLTVSDRSKSNLIMTSAYDALERQISVTDPRIGSTTYTYHTANGKIGLLQTITDAAGNITSYDYDAVNGRKIWGKNALNQYTRYAYNDRGQIVNIWGDAQYPVMFAYNQYGEQTNMWTFRTNADWINQTWPQSVIGDQTIWNYDPATGLLLSKTDAAGKAVTYIYDTIGQLTRRTWARGLHTDYQYDSLGQLTKVDYSDDTQDITYTYNRLGQPTTVQDAAGTRTFAYNSTFDLTSETIDGIYNKTLNRSYTTTGAKGRISGMNIGGVNNYTYSYDQYGRLNQITTPAGNYNYTRLANSDLISQMIRPNNVTTTWSYETNRDLITQVQNGTISIFGYTNDALGRRTAMSRSGSAFSNPDTLNYSYDNRSQVTGATSNVDSAYNYNYTYDPIGNRLTSNEAGTGKEYTSNALNQYTLLSTLNIQPSTSATPTYDDDGNMLTNNGWAYTWNAENRLVKAEKDIQKLEFAYDYMGRRIFKKVHDGETLAKHTSFVYDNFKLIEELNGLDENAVLKRYTWQPEGVGLDVPLQIYDMAIAKTYYYLTDANKNVMNLVDSSKSVVAHYEYDPFGRQNQSSGIYSADNSFRFSSEYYDEITALIYFNYRYYCVYFSRWLNRDPIEDKGSLNLYMYLNNCINLFDDLGLKSGSFTVSFNHRWEYKPAARIGLKAFYQKVRVWDEYEVSYEYDLLCNNILYPAGALRSHSGKLKTGLDSWSLSRGSILYGKSYFVEAEFGFITYGCRYGLIGNVGELLMKFTIYERTTYGFDIPIGGFNLGANLYTNIDKILKIEVIAEKINCCTCP